MDSNSSKRRKLGHKGAMPQAPGALGHNLDAASSAMFQLQVAELLEEVKIDYGSTFDHAEDKLKELHGIVQDIDTHGPISVRYSIAAWTAELLTQSGRSTKQRGSSRSAAGSESRIHFLDQGKMLRTRSKSKSRHNAML
jgi:hypothetical protein